jgi:IS605 OrfB family transposase
MPEEEEALLSAYASLYSKAERTLFARLQADRDLTVLKREFLPEFGITARQFNAMAAELKGKISSIKERRAGLIKEAEQRLARAKKVLKKISDPARHHQEKRRVIDLQTRLARLQKDHASGKVRLCFGSKKLFRAQFSSEGNGYASHEEWLKDWQAARNNQFFVIGSRDETGGCQSCLASVTEDGSITLRLRLPDALSHQGKYLTFSSVRFAYGHDEIVAAIGRNLSDRKADWQPVSYRFLKDHKGWRVFVSVTLPDVSLLSEKDRGVIGMDINPDHLAVAEADRFGNPVNAFSVPCVTYGHRAEQRKAIVGDAVKQVIALAVVRKKPLVLEKLDFGKRKAALEKRHAEYAQMLSALAYTQIQTIARARAFDAGIEVCEVNPAYTTVIGQYKFADRYGISRHSAAALVIGRRSFGFAESLPGQLHGTLPQPVRNRGRHVWSKRAVVARRASAAHAALRRSGEPRSLPSPVFGQGMACDHTACAGEIPACE